VSDTLKSVFRKLYETLSFIICLAYHLQYLPFPDNLFKRKGDECLLEDLPVSPWLSLK